MSRRREKSLERMAPHLVQEWHTERNGFLTPAVISFGSGKRAWWRCEKGHEWQERVSNRSHLGYGCPYCSGKRPTQERNFSVLYPSLMLEWHPTKNQTLDPAGLLPRSNRKVWWQCKEGHEWETSICSRTNGSGCPYCAGKRIWLENCLGKKYPNVARDWHPTKNGILTPRDVAPHSSKAVWWQCERGHEWRRKIAYEIDSQGCPYCSGRLACKDNSLATLHSDLAREWDVTKNGFLSPHDVTVKTRKRVWWRSDRGHSWQMNISVRCSGIGGCPYCVGKRVCEENSFQTLSPQITGEWDKEKNKDLNPELVTNHASIKVWWKCAKGHTWQALVRSRTIIGTDCPVCAGKVASPAYNLVTEYPDIALEWDLRKNNKPPETYLPYSNKEVWWKCRHCGSGWKSMIMRRTRERAPCPQCGS